MAGKRKAKPRAKDRARRATQHEESAELTDQQTLFVHHYLDTMNASEAARRAKYSAKSAAQAGCALLRNPKIRAKIDAGLAERCMGRDEVLARFSDTGRIDFGQFTDARGQLSLARAKKLGLMRFVRKITRTDKGGITVELHDQMQALAKLGEFHGLFKQRHEHSGPEGKPIQVETPMDLSALSADDRTRLRALLRSAAGTAPASKGYANGHAANGSGANGAH